MKNRFAKMLAGVLVTFGLLIQPGTSHAADAVLRDQRANHLLVAPGTAGSGATSRSTNVAEFRSLSGTNKFLISTNDVGSGPAVVGPRLIATIGGTNYFAVSNRWMISTNWLTGKIGTNRFINGIMVDDPALPSQQ